MKKIWYFLKHHVQEDFNKKHYLIIAIFLSTSISLNYYFSFDDDYLEQLTGLHQFFSYLIFYSAAYFFALVSYSLCYNKKEIFRQRHFWIKTLFAMVILAVDSSVPYLENLINAFTHPQVQLWVYKVINSGISLITIIIPIMIFYFFFEKNKNDLYGIGNFHFDARPYFMMLSVMIPLIVAASFNQSFLNQYPMYTLSFAHEYLGIPEWTTVMGYEAAYGFDFISVEYLFRGFMVIGMIAFLGRGSVLTMAVVYCFLHFGKPAGEAISSVFGGYLLGVVAYETKSIWGGVIVHVGIAWTMELVAFLQKNF